MVAGFDEGLEGRLDQLGDAAAEDHLLAEEIGLCLFLESRLQDPSPAGSDGRGIGECQIPSALRGIGMNREQCRDS